MFNLSFVHVVLILLLIFIVTCFLYKTLLFREYFQEPTKQPQPQPLPQPQPKPQFNEEKYNNNTDKYYSDANFKEFDNLTNNEPNIFIPVNKSLINNNCNIQMTPYKKEPPTTTMSILDLLNIEKVVMPKYSNNYMFVNTNQYISQM